MAQKNNKGMDSGFIELAQEQLDAVDARLSEVDSEIAALREERAALIEQKAHLEGLVKPSAGTNGARSGKVDVQATRDVVVELIRARGTAMHFRDDIYPALVTAGHDIEGKDPANTLLSRIYDDERLNRAAPGTYELAEWRVKEPSLAPKPAASPQRRAKAVDAAEEVLRAAGAPLHYAEIAKRMLKAGSWATNGKTPEATVGARIYKDVADHGSRSVFLKLGRGLIGLRGRDESAG